ncbi:MAG TPA: cobyrinate a,c-diamide synthase [Herpetosiphonaceae bacterium]|nr:cobyrinate a,c-diamide synthase [Herpetosiphonaceae bacterium]
MTARLVVAAPGSGSGKTTLTAGLIGALRERGLSVQPFKCGPDYIDPGYHTLAAGRVCRNLDTWLLPPDQVRMLFAQSSAGADLALIEGVMGLFDGHGASDDTGSTADVARLLDAPVVLVIDARGMARSAAALVRGFQQFDPRVRIAGVVLNRVGSARHAELCTTAIADCTGLPTFGYLERREDLCLPERHLGLITTAEGGPWTLVVAEVARALAQTCDLDALVTVARSAPPLVADLSAAPATVRKGLRPVIAVAEDAAFSFMYPEMAELLWEAGGEVVPFSPLTAATLPPGTAGIILSGGFPELYAARLSGNTRLHAAIRSAHDVGLPIYAECGGLMYLTEELVDQAGACWPMVGLLPGRSVMTARVTLGYRTVRAVHAGPLLPEGATVRGHEFHYSRWERPSCTTGAADLPPAYDVLPRDVGEAHPEGARVGSLLASYVHLHWLVCPEMAARFVSACRQTAGRMHG